MFKKGLASGFVLRPATAFIALVAASGALLSVKQRKLAKSQTIASFILAISSIVDLTSVIIVIKVAF